MHTRRFPGSRSSDAYVFGKDELALLDRPDLLPRLETLRLTSAIGCSDDDVHALSLVHRVTTFAFEDQHPSHARSFFEAGDAMPRRTRRLVFYFEPSFMAGKPPDFRVELAQVRDDETAPWTRLEVTAKLPDTLPHLRRTALDWLEQAIASLRGFAVSSAALTIDGKQVDDFRLAVTAALPSLPIAPLLHRRSC